jgi:hypothetical protein
MSAAIDNSEIVATFCPPTRELGQFIYTELIDRRSNKGNNTHRVVKVFHHRDRADFDIHWPIIRGLCDTLGVRAYTRLAPRSFASVGRRFTGMVVEAALSDNWSGMKSLYSRACGTAAPEQKYWLFDVDEINPHNMRFGIELGSAGLLRSTIPSRKGLHYITVPYDYLGNQNPRLRLVAYPHVSMHKDNPTNLYIPADAA